MIESCLIVGAGLAGLTAAKTLAARNIRVQVIEEGDRVGGRMATTSLQSATGIALFDHGAQFFTARSPDFKAAVAQWEKIGLVSEWFQGQTKVLPDGTIHSERDGHPRLSTTDGMDAIPQFIAQTLNVSLQRRVIEIKFDKSWSITTDEGEVFSADALILTPPVPQSLVLLEAGAVELPVESRMILDTFEYDPCLAVMLLLHDGTPIPAPGALYFAGEPISWIADNYSKGVSARPGAITVHAAAQFSRDYWDAEADEIVKILRASGAPWLDGQVVDFVVHRWRYAKPVQAQHDGYLAVPAHRLVFAGDAFAGSKVEGAYLSGLAAARYLLDEAPK